MEFSYTPTEIKNIIQNAGLHLSQKLGQNFLIDANLGRFILEQGKLTGQEFVLEVGTGIGCLTRFLVTGAKKVISYEIDKGVYHVAKRLLHTHENLELRHESIIHHNQFPLSLFEAVEQFGPPVIISNFPYSIATVFLLELGKQKIPFQRLVGAFQKEVGEKLLAQPGTKNYGIPSVLAQYYFEMDILKVLPPDVFWPQPKISSIILGAKKRDPLPEVADLEAFHAIVKGSFALRRKTLLNALSHYFSLSATEIKPAIVEAGFEPTIRGEMLSLEDFLQLTASFKKNIQKTDWKASS